MIPVLDPSLVSPTWYNDNNNGGNNSSSSRPKHQTQNSFSGDGGRRRRNRRRGHHGSTSIPSSSLVHKDSNIILEDDDDDGDDIDDSQTNNDHYCHGGNDGQDYVAAAADDHDYDYDDSDNDGHYHYSNHHDHHHHDGKKTFDDNDTDSTVETNSASDNGDGGGGGGISNHTGGSGSQPIIPRSVVSSSTSSSQTHRHHDSRRQQKDDRRNTKQQDYRKNENPTNGLRRHHHRHGHRYQQDYELDEHSSNSSNIHGGYGRNNGHNTHHNDRYENGNASIHSNNNVFDVHLDDNITSAEDLDTTKKWKSPVFFRLKTMSLRRRVLLFIWFISCLIIGNILSYASNGESLLEFFDIDTYHILRSVGLSTLAPQPVHICFITAQYTSTIDKKDNLVNLRQEIPKLFNKRMSQYFHFFAFTNQKVLIEGIDDQKTQNGGSKSNSNLSYNDNGWTVLVRPFYNFQRFITQSRWPKFQGHKDPELLDAHCEVVFYMDGTVFPRGSVYQFQAEARRILRSDVGMSQEVHPHGGGVSGEIDRCRLKSKDVEENLNATWTWLNSQPDFDNHCTLYQNTFFGYAVNSTSWNNASDFAWNRFSLELDSWRDQPLWCYTLHHFHIKPLIIPPYLFEYQGKRRGKGKHTYGKEAATAAHDFLTQPTKRDEATKEKDKQDAILLRAFEDGRNGIFNGGIGAIISTTDKYRDHSDTKGSGPRVSAPLTFKENEGETKEQRIERQRERIERARKRNALRQAAGTKTVTTYTANV